jgi:hypothetical protein
VCQVFKYYYFVPYNLFRLFLVHKMSIYAYVYENRKNGKRKKKRNFPANWVGGNFGPAGARERARQAAQLGPPEGDDAVGMGPHASEEGATLGGGDDGG